MMWKYMRNDLDSEYWRLSGARWDQIKVPVYSGRQLGWILDASAREH
jgi:hypothetical protein